MLLTHKDLLIQMEKIRKKVTGQDEKIDLIFNYLQQFVKQQETPRKPIGYTSKKDWSVQEMNIVSGTNIDRNQQSDLPATIKYKHSGRK